MLNLVSSLLTLSLLCLAAGCTAKDHAADVADTKRPAPAVKPAPPDRASKRLSSSLTEQKTESEPPAADVSEATTVYRRALARMVQGQFVEAIEGFTAALELCPTADAFSDRGMALLNVGEYDEAIKDFDAALRLNQTNEERARTYSRRAMVRTIKGDLDSALSDTDEALKIDRACITALSARSVVWQRKGDFAKAVADASKMTEVQPGNPLGYTTVALLYAAWPDASCRDAERAIVSAKRACEITDWRESHAIAALAAGYAEKSDFDAAVRWQKKVEDLAPDRWGDVERVVLQLYTAKKPYRLDNIGVKSSQQERDRTGSQ